MWNPENPSFDALYFHFVQINFSCQLRLTAKKFFFIQLIKFLVTLDLPQSGKGIFHSEIDFYLLFISKR